jgi:hypothetical protein
MSLLWLSLVTLLLAVPVLAQQDSSAAAVVPLTAEKIAVKSDSPVDELRVECTPASRASELVGTHGCVSGKVFRVTTRKSGATHISLCPSHSKCSFQAVVKARDRNAVGDLSYLQGRLVGVLGGVIQYRGHPEIVIKARQQIRAAADNPPLEFDAAQAKASGGQTSRGSKRNRAW